MKPWKRALFILAVVIQLQIVVGVWWFNGPQFYEHDRAWDNWLRAEVPEETAGERALHLKQRDANQVHRTLWTLVGFAFADFLIFYSRPKRQPK